MASLVLNSPTKPINIDVTYPFDAWYLSETLDYDIESFTYWSINAPTMYHV